MTKEQYIKTGSDESYSTPNLVKTIIPFIKDFQKRKGLSNLTIWCPFDLTEDQVIDGTKYFRSQYVELLEKEGWNVVATHLLTGEDFFETERDCDLIVSNPPFKNKAKFFERVKTFNKPYALVNTASWFNDGGVNNVFDSNLQLVIPNRRAIFFNDKGCIGDRPSFKSIYYCEGLCEQAINFVELDIKSDKKWIEENIRGN